jgi:hypothetical protein
VNFADGRPEQKFFIKSHRNMEVSGDSFCHVSADRSHYVDYKELLAYHVLAQLRVGPQVEFILAGEMIHPYMFETGLLIATQDLSCASGSVPTRFTTLHAMVDDMRSALREQGCVQKEEVRAHVDAFLSTQFSTDLCRHELKRIDLLCRLMRLRDVLPNYGNFGKLTRVEDGAVVGWRIVDFTVGHEHTRFGASRYVEKGIRENYQGACFSQFDGNELCYNQSHPLRCALERGDGKFEMNAVQDLFYPRGETGSYIPSLITAVNTARRMVVSLVEDNMALLHVDKELHEKKLVDLDAYIAGIFINFGAVGAAER